MKKSNTIDTFLYLSGVLIMLPIIMLFGVEYGIILLTIILFAVLLKTGKVKISKVYLYLLILSTITTLLLNASSMADKWKFFGNKHYVIFVIIVLLNAVSGQLFKEKGKLISFIKGIKTGCIIQIFWSIIQFCLYTLFKFNLNQFVFADIFHFTNRASRISSLGIIRVSGVGWHPALLIPILIIAYLLFDNLYMKLIILAVAVVTRNSTCLFAVIMCIFLEYVIFKPKKIKKVNKNTLLMIFSIVFICFIITVFKTDIFNMLITQISHTIERFDMVISNNIDDLSTSLHVRYYTYLPTIYQKTNIVNIIFGYGLECSGYPYSLYLNQFVDYSAWTTETDVINLLLGRGLLWTVIFYFWLLRGLIKGSKISYKYTIFYIVIILCGILYNNQFPWIIIIEIVIEYCIKNDCNFFDLLNTKKLKNIDIKE